MLESIIKANRSYRSFKKSERLPVALLRELVDICRYAPSSVNLQPLKYKIIHTEEDCAKIEPHVRYAKALKNITLPPKGHEPAAYIVIFLDTAIADNLLTFRRDVGIVAQTMLLCAVDKGYGGCMIGNFDAEDVSKICSAPEGYAPQLVVALGVPDEEIILELAEDGKVGYYRDENNVHHVPKRPLDEILF